MSKEFGQQTSDNQMNKSSWWLRLREYWGQKQVSWKATWVWARHVATFVVFLSAYLVMKGGSLVGRSRFCPVWVREKVGGPMNKLYWKLLDLNRRSERTINQYNLIELALRSMAYKKARTAVTIGGMGIGVAAIVFLVSVGFGLQRLVISRVARLEEMKQADVSLSPGSTLKIDDETVAKFADVGGVEMALPAISVVARVAYQQSAADMVVYGVTTDYLEQSAIRPVRGKVFESRAVANTFEYEGEVAGVSDEAVTNPVMGGRVRDVQVVMEEGNWLKVREEPNLGGAVLGYVRALPEELLASEVWGEDYLDNDWGRVEEYEGQWWGRWISARVPVWEKTNCSSVGLSACENGYEPKIDDTGQQEVVAGYFAKIGVEVVGEDGPPVDGGEVLGETDEGLVLAEADEASSAGEELAWVEIASEAGIIGETQTKTVDIGGSAIGQAVVNRAMLQVLNLTETQAIGKEFDAEYVVTGDLLPDSGEQIVSAPATYEIVGVSPEDSSPFFYVPLVDLKTLGITNYSSVKLVTESSGVLSKVRQQVEAMGFGTISVADTVAQIDRLFATARSILALVGFVALSVASLGMFNTLTVSLLERTHEVGLMKALGMKSHEVQELFLTESMIMGFFGGVLGAVLGVAAGKLLGLVLSVVGVVKGVGLINVSYTPFSFLVLVFGLSLFVGLLTGIFPARRAMRISALDALRYE